jgi:hypothetical protein
MHLDYIMVYLFNASFQYRHIKQIKKNGSQVGAGSVVEFPAPLEVFRPSLNPAWPNLDI